MAILKSEEVRDMAPEEMNEKIAELKQQLLREKSMISSGGAPENPGKIREIRRTIARILTIKKQKEG